MNPEAIEGHFKLVLVQWMVIIAAAWALGRLARRFGQPLVVGEILAGILLGPSLLGLIWPAHWPVLFPSETQQSLQVLGKIGLIFLLFQVGMEIDFSHIRSMSRSRTVLAVSMMGMAVPFLGGLAIGPWLHDRFAPLTPLFGFQFFLCISLSITALPVLARILLEMKLERTQIGAMSISAAAIDDVAGWILLGVATTMVTSNFSIGHLAFQLAGILAFYLFLQRMIGPWFRQLWRESRSRSMDDPLPHSLLALLLTGLFASALITHELGIFTIFGAFLFGVCLHQETGLVKAWRDRFSYVIFVAFVPVFFTNTGLNTNIGLLKTPETWLACVLVLLTAVAGKLGGCYWGARAAGQRPREAGCIAAFMNTRGLMALIAINIGLDMTLLTPALYTMLIIMTLLTTAMCGPLLRRWLPRDQLT